MLRMIFVFILTVSLTFLPAGPTAFAAPDEPDEEVSVEAPAPELAGADDIDWVTEAEVLDTLKTLNDIQLNRISRDITVATVEHVQAGDIGAQYTLGAVMVAAGFGAVIVGIKEWPYRREAFGTPSWVGWVIVGAAMVVTGALVVKTADVGVTVERVTHRELREIVGEDVAQQLENLQQWLARVDRALDQKDYIDFQLTPSLHDNVSSTMVQSLQVSFQDVDRRTGKFFEPVSSHDISRFAEMREEWGTWVIRLSRDKTPVDVFQRVKNHIKSQIFEGLLQEDFVSFSVSRHISGTVESAASALSEVLDNYNSRIGPAAIGMTLDSMEQPMVYAPVFFSLDTEQLFNEADQAVTLRR